MSKDNRKTWVKRIIAFLILLLLLLFIFLGFRYKKSSDNSGASTSENKSINEPNNLKTHIQQSPKAEDFSTKNSKIVYQQNNLKTYIQEKPEVENFFAKNGNSVKNDFSKNSLRISQPLKIIDNKLANEGKIMKNNTADLKNIDKDSEENKLNIDKDSDENKLNINKNSEENKISIDKNSDENEPKVASIYPDLTSFLLKYNNEQQSPPEQISNKFLAYSSSLKDKNLDITLPISINDTFKSNNISNLENKKDLKNTPGVALDEIFEDLASIKPTSSNVNQKKDPIIEKISKKADLSVEDRINQIEQYFTYESFLQDPVKTLYEADKVFSLNSIPRAILLFLSRHYKDTIKTESSVNIFDFFKACDTDGSIYNESKLEEYFNSWKRTIIANIRKGNTSIPLNNEPGLKTILKEVLGEFILSKIFFSEEMSNNNENITDNKLPVENTNVPSYEYVYNTNRV